MTPELRAAVMALSSEEKRALAEELLASLDEYEDEAMPPELYEELERRRLKLEQKPESACTWDDVERQIQASHG